MTDHLAEARAAIHAEHGWSMAAPASSLADMAYAIAHILDHLDAQQTEPEPDPLDESNHTDRIDRDGYRWVWCVGCDGFRMDGHEVCESGIGFTADGIDEGYGPLTFAPR